MWQEWFIEFENLKEKQKNLKNKIKALDKIIKICEKNNLQIIKSNNELIIRGFFRRGDDQMSVKNKVKRLNKEILNLKDELENNKFI